MHDNALGLFVKFQAEKLDKHSMLFLSKTQPVISELNTVISSGKIVDVSSTNVLLEEANSVLESANKLFSHHHVNTDSSSCYSRLS